MITKLQATQSLLSETCPACDGFKPKRKSVCSLCWNALPKNKRDPLYRLIGKGYEAAINDAVDHLKIPVSE